MLKKIISVLLAAVLLLSALGVSAFAVKIDLPQQTATSKNSTLKKIVSDAAAELIGEIGKVDVSDALFEEIVKKVGSGATAKSVREVMSGYAVLDISELPESARAIAETAEYKILKGNVVYIVIEIDKNPELLDMITLCQVSHALYEKQNAFVEESGKSGLKVNTYRHIVGELALHCAVYSLTKAAGGANKKNPLYFFYESARECELNQTELRGVILINLLGLILTSLYDK